MKRPRPPARSRASVIGHLKTRSQLEALRNRTHFLPLRLISTLDLKDTKKGISLRRHPKNRPTFTPPSSQSEPHTTSERYLCLRALSLVEAVRTREPYFPLRFPTAEHGTTHQRPKRSSTFLLRHFSESIGVIEAAPPASPKKVRRSTKTTPGKPPQMREKARAFPIRAPHRLLVQPASCQVVFAA